MVRSTLNRVATAAASRASAGRLTRRPTRGRKGKLILAEIVVKGASQLSASYRLSPILLPESTSGTCVPLTIEQSFLYINKTDACVSLPATANWELDSLYFQRGMYAPKGCAAARRMPGSCVRHYTGA